MVDCGQGISLVSMLQISSSRSHKIVNQSKIVAVRGLISNKIYLVLSTPKTGEFRLKVAECMIRSIWTRRSVVPPTLAIYVMFNILRMLSIYMSNNATSFNTWVLSLTHIHTLERTTWNGSQQVDCRLLMYTNSNSPQIGNATSTTLHTPPSPALVCLAVYRIVEAIRAFDNWWWAESNMLHSTTSQHTWTERIVDLTSFPCS